MTFLITLIALLIERFFDWSHIRQWKWFLGYQRWLQTTLIAKWPMYVVLLIEVLPLLIVVGVLNCILSNFLYGVLKLIFGLLVLMYCFGPANSWAEHANDDNVDTTGAAWIAELFPKIHARVFAVVFWFVIVGPVGCVFYRVLDFLKMQPRALQVKEMLDWLPARLFTFLFALGGHFTRVFSCWKKKGIGGLASSDALLSECGIAAMDIPNENSLAKKEILALVDRVLIIGLVLLAIIVLSL